MKVTGATVHYVNEVVDGGQIIAQKAVDVLCADAVLRLLEDAVAAVLAAAHDKIGDNGRFVKPDGSYNLSILKSMDGDESCCCRYFFEYDAPVAGTGHFISTYRGDGSPLPSFAGEPIPVDVAATNASTLARELWESLNAENKVSLFVQFRSLAGSYSETSIINKNGPPHSRR